MDLWVDGLGMGLQSLGAVRYGTPYGADNR